MSFLILNFAEAKQPEYREKRAVGYIEYGNDNNYPNYLINLFNKSAKHNAIVKGKVNYIIGNGWSGDTDDAKKFIESPNYYDTLNDLTRKICLDIELFGGCYMECIWSVVGEQLVSVSHIDYSKVRTNKDNTQFWIKDNWNDRKEQPEVLHAFNEKKKTGKQVLYIKEYRPDLKAYSLPGYFGALNYIESDIEVSRQILGNALTGFSASKLITLPNGEPTNEEKRDIERRFTDRFSGADGKKFILSFVNDSGRKPIVDDLGASDLSKEDFTHVDSMIQQNIFAGHSITSPMLFGVMEAGKLGGRTEMRDAYEIFKNTYSNDKQRFIEGFIKYLFSFTGEGELKIVPIEPIGIDLSQAYVIDNLTKEEIREKLGLAPLEKIAEKNIKSELDYSQQFNEAELKIFNEYGESKDDYIVVKERKIHFENNEGLEDEYLYESFADQQLTSLEEKILSAIQKDKRIGLEVLSDVLKTDIKIINKIINNFIEKGVIVVNKAGEKTLSKPLSEMTDRNVTKFVIRYSYEWLPAIPYGQRDSHAHPSRRFCKALMNAHRVYSRSDIEQMSARLGWSVFDRRGGWWTKPTGEHSPSCRHQWVNQILIKK